ncbi:MAG: hypothetical protein WDA24_07325 [Tissierellales bacterium]
MKCEYCSHDNEPGVKFCGKCGAQIPDKPMNDDNKADIKSTVSSVTNMVKAKPLSKLLKFAIPAVLVIIAIVIASSMFSGSGVSIAKDSINFFYEEDMVIVSGNNNPKFTIDGVMHSSQKSLDGSKAVVLTDYNYENGGVLWFVTTSNQVKIAEDVVGYKLSDTGKGVAYYTDFDSENSIASLYLYDTASKKTTRLSDEATFLTYEPAIIACISPDGKSVAFTSDYDISNDEVITHIKVDNKPVEKFGENMVVLAISDGGKYIYYAKVSNDGSSASLRVKSGKNDNRLISDLSSVRSNTTMILNEDYSQVIFNRNDKAYISQKGNEATKISNSLIDSLMLPSGSQVAYNYNNFVFGVSSLENNIASNSDGLLYINDKFETARISGSPSYGYRSFVSNDGKRLVFVSSSDILYVIDPTKPDAERIELAEDVKTFISSNDGKTIYYINDVDELWCVKGTGKPTKISDDVTGQFLTMSPNSNKLFFLVDHSYDNGGELYYTNNGSKREKISGGEEVGSIWSTPSNIFFVTVDYDLYRSSGNEKFELFQEEANIGY